jgi:hypothetical protein
LFQDSTGIRWLGVAIVLGASWPMWEALEAVGSRDYLGGLLLLGLTYVVARTGVELAGVGAGPGGD